jgi:hypothetical protein
MNVYPQNHIEYAQLTTQYPLLTNAGINFAYTTCLEQTAKWSGNTGDISFNWGGKTIYADSIIIGNTTAGSAEINLQTTLGTTFTKQALISDLLTIIEIPDDLSVLSGTIRFEGTGDITAVGYVLFGNKMTLPRFAAKPQKKKAFRSDTARTLGGNAYGLYVTPLFEWAADYLRITDEEMKIIDDYAETVLNLVPHVIDLYPEAHEKQSPLFATLIEGFEATKRNENGFFWDLSLSWMEVK